VIFDSLPATVVAAISGGGGGDEAVGNKGGGGVLMEKLMTALPAAAILATMPKVQAGATLGEVMMVMMGETESMATVVAITVPPPSSLVPLLTRAMLHLILKRCTIEFCH